MNGKREWFTCVNSKLTLVCISENPNATWGTCTHMSKNENILVCITIKTTKSCSKLNILPEVRL